MVQAVRARLSDAENSNDPIALTGGERLSIEVGDTRWSISASDASSVVRGASVSVSAEVSRVKRGPTGADPRRAETAGVVERARRVDPIVFLPFQRRFLKRSLSIDTSISALSIPRGGGKSMLASRLLDEALPGGPAVRAGS